MILKCPSCSTTYNFPDDKFQPGRKVKCTVCGHIFVLDEPKPEPALDEALSQPDDELENLFEDHPVAERVERPVPPDPSPAAFDEPASSDEFTIDEPRSGKSVREEFSIDGAGESGKKIDLDALVRDDTPKRKGGRSKNIIIISMMLLVLLAAAGYFFLPWFMDKDKDEVKQPAEATEAVITTEQIKNFALEDVKQYYVDNEKVGKLFVVQGKVVNNFEVPKELIKVEATLFDAGGASVVSKTLLIGNTVSLFQLQMLSQEELEATINNKVGILTSNTRVLPRGEVPFVIVFYNPPDSVQEFVLKVVSAKDPPKQ